MSVIGVTGLVMSVSLDRYAPDYGTRCAKAGKTVERGGSGAWGRRSVHVSTWVVVGNEEWCIGRGHVDDCTTNRSTRE